jgi:hypothetical protein
MNAGFSMALEHVEHVEHEEVAAEQAGHPGPALSPSHRRPRRRRRAAEFYPADRFRDGRTGEEHRADARDRLLFWLTQRWQYGFSEWNSHYNNEDIAALSDLVDFARDEEIKSKATVVLDLLLLDMARRADLLRRGTSGAAPARTTTNHGEPLDGAPPRPCDGERQRGGVCGAEVDWPWRADCTWQPGIRHLHLDTLAARAPSTDVAG